MERIQSLQIKTKKVKRGQIVYAINEDNQTADIINPDFAKNNILIPKSILYENKEYIIKKIQSFAFQNSKVQMIQFPPDSELESIGNNAFYMSPIQNISLPPSVLTLDPLWCGHATNLKSVTVMPNNPRYKHLNEKVIVGKSGIKNDEYDVLIFVWSEIDQFTIPSNIHHIGSYSMANLPIKTIKLTSNITKICEGAFNCCYQLESVEIPPDSNLQIIEKNAFNFTPLLNLMIPSDIIEMQDGWCCGTSNLTNITIIQKEVKNIIYYEEKLIIGKSNIKSGLFDILLFARRDIKTVEIPLSIKIISQNAFASSSIENIRIPPQISEIKEFAFSQCSKLRNVEIPLNSGLKSIGGYAFSGSSIEKIYITPHITQILDNTFSWCNNLHTIEFPENSKLQIIGKSSFWQSSIEVIYIPKSVTQIHQYAFAYCTKLQNFEIPTDSQLQLIENDAFINTKIKSLTLPSSIYELRNGWCRGTSLLSEIKIIPKEEKNILLYDDKIIIGKSDIKSDNFDILCFAFRDIKTIKIPQTIRKIASYSFSESSIENVFLSSQVNNICEYAFSECKNIRNVEIPFNSELKIIDKYAFYQTSLQKIFIPQKVSRICERAFFMCTKLRYVDFASDSELITIEEYAFAKSSIECIVIPQNVSKIYEYAFSFCPKLKIIEIESLELASKPIKQLKFNDCNAIVMIPANVKK